jgi:hypothetical protein
MQETICLDGFLTLSIGAPLTCLDGRFFSLSAHLAYVANQRLLRRHFQAGGSSTGSIVAIMGPHVLIAPKIATVRPRRHCHREFIEEILQHRWRPFGARSLPS